MYEPTDPRRLCYEAMERALTSKTRWQPVYGDVMQAGVKIGHVVSDGYSHKGWTFWPADESRRCKRVVIPINHERRVIEINATVPTWCGAVVIGPFKTYDEMTMLPIALQEATLFKGEPK